MKSRRIWIGCLLGFVLLASGLMISGEPEKKSLADTTISNIVQTAASSTSVTLSWEGTAKKYVMYQYTSTGEELGKLGVVTSPVTINSLLAGSRNYFRLFEADEKGNKASDSDPGVLIPDVRTLPKKQDTPELSYWYRASDEADFTWAADSQVDGYQMRVEKLNGKKLTKKNITAESVSGQAIILKTISPCYRGRVACVRVRGYILLNGQKLFSEEWSEPLYYASSKKLNLSGAKDTIKVSGLKVKDASRKVIYVSRKKKSGYKKAKTLGPDETNCEFSEYGGKMISSGINGRTYHVRVYYYCEVDGKQVKSPVYDEGSVYVKPTYFDIEIG